MAIKLNKILKDILKDQKIDKLETTKKDIMKMLGEKFYKNQITKMYLNNDKVVIEAKYIEAKTELNLIKKNSNMLIGLP
tara:strand:- start:790 stop:1026 length:237 start_codon:yes stop_codon:yes gene_type:complete